MPLVLKTLKTFFLAKTRKRYYHIHTSTPPCRQKHTPPWGMHVVVVGRVQPPPPLGTPPRPSCQYPPPLPPNPPPKF